MKVRFTIALEIEAEDEIAASEAVEALTMDWRQGREIEGAHSKWATRIVDVLTTQHAD